jgi:predicted membrane protein
MALYAGASVARARAPASPGRGAAWGALVGPLWALAMALLSSLANDFLYGNPDLDSVFSTYLIAGAVLGALGGLVASQPQR